MLESLKTNKLQYQPLTEEEKAKRHILGTLSGPCADTINPTRNEHYYDNDCWETLFDSPLINEHFENGGIFGELGHPFDDREDVDIEKVAICMPEKPKKNKDGLLIGYWHILDTPCGRILKTLYDYGYKFGISTRGTGDVDNSDGVDRVIPESYSMTAMDIVTIPAVKSARLSMTESLKKKKSLTESLNKLVRGATAEQKKAMNEALANLNITITSPTTGENEDVTVPVELTNDKNGNINIANVEEGVEHEEEPTEITINREVVESAQQLAMDNDVAKEMNSSESDDNIEVNDTEDEEAEDVGDSLMDDLQEALKDKQILKKENENLRESLSVGIAKEQKLKEQVSDYRVKIVELVEEAKHNKGLKARASKFESDNKTLSEKLDSNIKTINLQKLNIKQLEKLRTRAALDASNQESKLVESQKEVARLNNQIKTLNEKLSESISNAKKESETLTEGLKNETTSLKEKNELLVKQNKQLASRLKKLAESYAQLSGSMYGVDEDRIISNMKDYSAEEINSLTESLVNRRVVQDRLPFKTISKINYTKPRDLTEGMTNKKFDDDYIDDSLDILFEAGRTNHND